MKVRPLVVALATALAVPAALGTTAVSASTASVPVVGSPGAPSGEPWVVSLGDSYISGEAGRWAGNQSGSTNRIDALGPGAYWDAGKRESIERCHRSRSAAIHIGEVNSLNLACSGAITKTKTTSEGWFKPGIDFYNEGGRKGQALMLQEFATDHNVKMVALSISGNDFHFADIFTECVKDFLAPFATPHCKDSDTVQTYLNEAAQEKVRNDTTTAILNVAQAMENAGYADSEWTLVLQTYPLPIPRAEDMRYPESGYSRQYTGGCGLRNADLNWAATTVLPMINRNFQDAAVNAQTQRPGLQVAVMDSSRAFQGHELCNKSVERVNSKRGVESWREPDAVDRSEWAMEINIINAGDTYGQESLHPNYWGQLALRNCWRQVWNDGNVQGGACEPLNRAGLTRDCEPAMRLTPTATRTAAVVTEPPLTWSANTKVTLRCPGISMKPGDVSALRGRVTPADNVTAVQYQVRWGGGEWRSKAITELDNEGRYRLPIKVAKNAPEGRVYEWRVVALNESGIVAVSQTRSTIVR